MGDPALQHKVWTDLEKAGPNPEHPFHVLGLSSTGLDGAPRSRMLILRTTDARARSLEFHTNVHSGKWSELGKEPRAAVLGYDPANRIQIRLTGDAQVFGPDAQKARTAWEGSSFWTRTTYCPDASWENAPNADTTAHGFQNFGVVALRMRMLDWFDHTRGQIRRAQFDYDSTGNLADLRWVAP